jgi:hypothetical protein
MNSNWITTIAVAMLAVWPAVAQDARAALVSRAKSFEPDTPYVPPPGDPLSHYTAGYAKIMCSAVFITGLDPEFAAENRLVHKPTRGAGEGGLIGYRPPKQDR